MDNFLKAHSVKKRSYNPVHKTDNARLKNKLKLMLTGYKQKDNSVIRRATELTSFADDNAACAQEVDSALQDDSDFELVDAVQVERSSSSERSASGSPDHSSTSSPPRCLAPFTDSPPRSPTSPLSPPSKRSPILSRFTSSYVSLKENDAGEMMNTINGILNSDSVELDQSFAGVSDFDSSIHDMETFVPVDSSMDLSYASSSSISEFDANGQLALSIMDKIKASMSKENDKCIEKLAPHNDGKSMRVKKRKHTQKVLPNEYKNLISADSSLPNLKIKKSKKVKEPQQKAFEEYVSIDASKHSFADPPNLFTYGTLTQNELSSRIRFKEKASDIFGVPTHGLRNAKINDCSENLSSTYTTDGESEDSLPPTTSVEVSDELIEYSSNSENEEKVLENSIAISDDGVHPEQNDLTQNLVEFLHLKNSCILILRHPSQIYILGKVKATALCGISEVMGYRLQQGSADIFAPRFNYAVDIKTVAEAASQFGLFGKLTSIGLSVADTEDTVVSLNEHDSIIHLEPLQDIKLDFVEEQFPADVFNKSNKIMSEQFPLAAETLSCTLYIDKPSKSFVENPIWPEIVKFSSGITSKGIVCGGKGTGKSTFLKYYINKMLKNGPILLIDLDPGQPELTVAGNVSVTVVRDPLLGPNFTHLQKPQRMLNVGLINVDDNMDRYLSAISKLVQYATTQEYQCMPWIVNTMGLSNALGLKLIAYIILLVKPTFVVQMDSNIQKKCFGTILNTQEIKRLFAEEYNEDPMFENLDCPEDFFFKYYMSSSRPAGPESSQTAKEKRYLCYLSYFGKVLSRMNKLFLGTKPYVLCSDLYLEALYSDLENKPKKLLSGHSSADMSAFDKCPDNNFFCLFSRSEYNASMKMSLHNLKSNEITLLSLKIATTCVVNENFVTDILNAKIVALCETHTETEGRVFTLEENSLICHGHGVVRAVDLDNGSIYIITPERETLARVNVLLYSDTHPDLALSCTGLPDRTCLPFRAVLLQRSRQLMKSPKRRFNPIPHLLKMKRLRKHKL